MAKSGGYGVTVKIEISSVLTAIADVADVEFPEFEKYLADSTSHGSTGGYVEYISSGVRECKEFKMTLTWDKTANTHAALVTGFNSDSTVNMSIMDPKGQETISFAAHIRKLGRVAKIKAKYECTVTIQPSGQPTIV